VDDVCKIYDAELAVLLSPTVESSDLGRCQVALFLRYLQELRGTPDRFIPGVARLTFFPPVVLAMTRVKENKNFTRLDLVTITSVLYLLFTTLLPEQIQPNRIFEFALQCMSVVATFGDEQINLVDGLYRPSGRLEQFESYSGCLQNIFREVPDLEPVPLTADLRKCARSVFVRIRPHVGLLICPSPLKTPELMPTLMVINPMNRATPVQHIGPEALPIYANFLPTLPLPRAIDPYDVQQLVIFVFEANERLSDEAMVVLENIFAYMLTRMSMLPCVGAVMVTDGEPATPEFTTDLQSLSRFNWPPLSRSVWLWDTLMTAGTVLRSQRDSYTCSQLRIVVITGLPAGRSVARVDPRAIPPTCQQSRIILDAISLVADPDLNTVATESGGYNLIVDANNMDRALQLIDSRGFLDVRLRQGGGRHIPGFEPSQVIAPRPQERMHPNRESRLRRKFQDVRQTFADLVLVEEMIDVWELTIRVSQPGCIYAGFPWKITVDFTAGYPNEPPKIRFTHPPYHINVADDGEICLAILTTQYRAAVTMVQVFQGIQAVLINPETGNALSPYRLRLFLENKQAFVAAAREWMARFRPR
jgi:ubiquitin-protein ligase